MPIVFALMPSCASTEEKSDPSINLAVWFPARTVKFPISHLLRNYLADSNETCLLCSLQYLLVQVQKKFRSVDKFGRLVRGSDLVKFPIDRLVIASPPTSGRIFLALGQNVPLSV